MEEREPYLVRLFGDVFAYGVVALFFIGPLVASYLLIRDGYWWGLPLVVFPSWWFGWRMLPALWSDGDEDRTPVDRARDWYERRRYG